MALILPISATQPQGIVGGFPTIVDSSMLGSYKTCQNLFHKTYIEQWKPKEHSVHLHAGGAFAKGVEVARTAYWTGLYVWGKFIPATQIAQDDGSILEVHAEVEWTEEQRSPFQAEDSIACGIAALLAAYGDFQCPAESAKSCERMVGALEFYFDNYPFENSGDTGPIELPGGKRAIEFSFAEPCNVLHPVTGDPILIVGRMDAIERFAGGNFITDEKTTTQLGSSWGRQWDLRGQFTGYAWGASKSDIKVDGAIVRGVSILKTKYETQQCITYRPQWQIDRWYSETCEWIEEMKVNWKRGIWRHNFDHACAEYGGCALRLACASEDESSWLSTFFERRHWNPLLRSETKLK